MIDGLFVSLMLLFFGGSFWLVDRFEAMRGQSRD